MRCRGDFQVYHIQTIRETLESDAEAWGANAFHAKEFYPGSGVFKRDTPQKQLRFEDDSRRIPEMSSKAI